jgi:hypothetical protein
MTITGLVLVTGHMATAGIYNLLLLLPVLRLLQALFS